MAAAARLTRRVRLDRAWTRAGPHLGPPISRLFLAASAGVLTVTCVSAVLILMSPEQTARQRALGDGRQMVRYLWTHCGRSCAVQAVTQSSPGTWLMRVQTPKWRRCFLITPADYAYIPGHGLVGLSATACRQ